MLSMASSDDSSNATSTAVSSFFSIEPFINGTESIGTNSSNSSSDEFILDPCHPLNALFNCSVEDFLVFARGSKQMPLETTIPITIFFVGIFLTGVIGNLIVCVVIVKHASMHTATNYYLFSLAVSDLLFLMMGLPYDLSLYWHQYPYNLGLAFCKIRALISEASTYVSVLTIVAFSMERFLAICHPLHLYTMSGLQRAVRIIAVLWVISFLSAVPFAVFTKIHYLNYPPTDEQILDSAFCAMLDNPKDFPLWEVSTCVFFAFPMVIMIILYGRMGLKIRSRTRQSAALGVQGSIHGESKQTQSRRAIIRMLAAVVCLFFVCWAPFHAQRLLYLYGQDIEYFKILNQYLFAVSGWLYYVSCTINPILYNVMSHRYRIAFRETLCSRKRWGSSAANGFTRDQSSFRETTIAGAGRDHSESSRLLRVKSMMPSSNRYSIHKDNNRLSSSVRWKDKNDCKNDIKDHLENDIKLNHIAENVKNGNSSVPSADLVVCIGGNLNGNTKPKCYTTSVTIPTTTVSTTTSATDGQSPQLLNNNSSSISNNNSKLTNLATNKQDNGKINCLKMMEKDCIARIEDASETDNQHHLSSSNEFLFNGNNNNNNNNSSVCNPVSNKQQQVNQQQQQPLQHQHQQQQHQQNQYQQENILSKFRTETCI